MFGDIVCAEPLEDGQGMPLRLGAAFQQRHRALVLPFADTEAMNLHLAEIARTVAPGAHAVLVLDGAGWHGGQDWRSRTTSRCSPCRPTRPS